ncbi:MAG: general secretion pathway protein GspK [Candidatus Sumerlaeia bacterium]|nr:general secretion pathway protein GspK [Candidatus Sumerlaeia bacterium]
MRTNNQKGVILLGTLWLAVVLAIIAYSLAYQVQLEMKLTKLFRQRAQATALARAGIARAVADLKNDLMLDVSEEGQRFDAEGDIWAKPDDKTDVELGQGTYTVVVTDESGKLNLNTVNLEVLKQLLIVLGVDEDKVEEIAFAIIDWRDTNDRPASGEGEKENVYFSKLIREAQNDKYADDDETVIYYCKNDNFNTVEELLDVYGITPELFYGYDPHKKLESELERSEKPTEREEKKPGLRDLVTVYGEGHLNVNTASKEVLMAVLAAIGQPGADPEEQAEAIIKYRRKNKDKDIDNEQAFRNWQELAQVEGFNPLIARQMYSVQPLCTASNVFRITATGKVGEVTQTITTTVVRSLEVFNTEELKYEKLGERLETKRRDESREETTIREPTIRGLDWLQP